LADSCVLPEPRCPVTPTRQHTPDRDNPSDPAALTLRKPLWRHTQSATTKFAEEPNYVIAVRNYVIVSPSELGNYMIADTN
jgi:hypothetical protein